MEFIKHNWQPYTRLEPDDKRLQAVLAIPTECIEYSDGLEYTFVPTTHIEELLNIINDRYSILRVEDTTVALEHEVYFTSKIEGAKTTLKRTHELLNGAYVDETNYFSEMMVKGAFNATKFLNLHGNKINKELLLEVWNILVDGCCDNESIRGDRFRIGNVQIGNHVGLHPLLLEDAMDCWFEFYNSQTFEDYPFLKAIILHYAFEYIHPFCDGNGRTGRLLMNNYLISRYLDKIKAVSFSHMIDNNRLEYNLAFQQSENAYSDITPFIHYMLDMMRLAFYDCLNVMSSSNYPEVLVQEALKQNKPIMDIVSYYDSLCPIAYKNLSYLERAVKGLEVSKTL